MENNEKKTELEIDKKKEEFLQEKIERFLNILKESSLVKELGMTDGEIVKIVKELINRYPLKKE